MITSENEEKRRGTTLLSLKKDNGMELEVVDSPNYIMARALYGAILMIGFSISVTIIVRGALPVIMDFM